MKFQRVALAVVMLLANLWAQTTVQKTLQITVAPQYSPNGVPLSDCGVLKSANTRYYLTSDVSSSGTCFSVQASGIFVDLNGYTITYGVGNTVNRRYGFLAQACYDVTVDGNPCGGDFNNLTVMSSVAGAKIIQGGGGAFSHGIRVGQGGGKGLKVYGVEFQMTGDSSKSIHTTYAGGGADIYNNYFRALPSWTLTTGSRHQIDGAQVFLGEQSTATVPNQIHDNIFVGSKQGAAHDTSPFGKIYNNTIQLDAYYTNDFCVYAYGTNMDVYGNICDNSQTAGRGIHIRGANNKVHNNTITVRELPRNLEYSGACQIGGAYGIQFEGTNSGESYSNKIVAIAGACDANGIRASVGTTTTVSTSVSYDEDVTVVRETLVSPGKAVGIVTLSANGHKVKNSTVNADTNFWSDVSQDAGKPNTNVEFINVTFKKGINAGTNFHAWRPANYAYPATMTCTSCILVGADERDTTANAVTSYWKQYTLFINGHWKIYNDTVQAVIVQQL